MTRLVLYVAHPVAPTADDMVRVEEQDRNWALAAPIRRDQLVKLALNHNLRLAMQWLSWLRRSFPETTFIAPWIADIQAGADDTDPTARERGLVDCCAVVERCDGIVLVGPRISTGMARERDHGMMRFKIWVDPADQPPTFQVYDLTANWESPPGHPYSPEFDDFSWSQSNPIFFDQIQRIQGLGKG